MSKRKGMSLEEKRKKLNEIFVDTKDVFQLKEVEKIGSKSKGLNSMQIKEILQSLVDDNMVECEKIGTSNYYWSFPSKAILAKKQKSEELTKSLESAKQKLSKVEKELKSFESVKDDLELKKKELERLKTLTETNTQLKKELAQYKHCDPEETEKKKDEIDVAKEAANRWTDAVINTKTWCQKNFNIEEETFKQQFGIPEDLDYIE
ncbi:Meiotic nuclear division protein 1 -like protein [Halotydeus destructor]|nr:Meiotic nuclear division protein 1 -like protein [Halotydeus destructor]